MSFLSNLEELSLLDISVVNLSGLYPISLKKLSIKIESSQKFNFKDITDSFCDLNELIINLNGDLFEFKN